MTAQSPELQPVLERLAKLERQNNALRRSAVALLAVLVAAICGVLFVGAAPVSKEVEATAFILNDESGKVRAKLFMDRAGPSLSLYDSTGGLRANLGEFGEGEGLILYNNPSELYGGVSVLLLPDGPSVLLSSFKHGGFVGFSNVKDGPQLEIRDSEGYSADIGATSLVTPATGETHKTSAASVVLFDKGNHVIWSAP